MHDGPRYRDRQGAAMLKTKRRVRLTGHGLRTTGDWESDPIGALSDACRQTVALDKLLGESIRRAHDAGHSWPEIGRVLGAAEEASSWEEVSAGLARNRTSLWNRHMEEKPGADA